ncbi:hypothetical protein [Sorangium sp. So ce394]|uniref:hypothetical protein n=1 Tax=Sorangium sp. So ce394 TaxID=3133310 RepID=UPI003F5C84D6
MALQPTFNLRAALRQRSPVASSAGHPAGDPSAAHPLRVVGERNEPEPSFVAVVGDPAEEHADRPIVLLIPHSRLGNTRGA